ncbi:MAG: hypothetical protein FWB90_01770 [Fibromonadales bacterium]|nr:hypothetical protein [Fibromonadales bacterium]
MFRIFLFLFASLLFAATPQMIKRDLSKRILFKDPNIQTSYSPLMQEKNARADSLLPALNGDMALGDLLAANPNLWSIENLRNEKNLSTNLHVNIIYIDGTREEAYCDFSRTTNAQRWELSIGLDFVSGSSNLAGIHTQQCLDQVRDSIGYAIKDSTGKIQTIPSKQILEEIERSKIPDIISIDLQMKLLDAHRSVAESGQCPSDIEAYLILLDVWEQVKGVEIDLPAINDALDRKTVQSCAFNREWNKKYSETATFRCNSSDVCEYNQSEDGKTFWRWNAYDNRLEFERKKFLFISYGKKSVREGGTMLDLRITPLSSMLFLESYMNLKGEPVSLGLIIISASYQAPF